MSADQSIHGPSTGGSPATSGTTAPGTVNTNTVSTSSTAGVVDEFEKWEWPILLGLGFIVVVLIVLALRH